MLDPYDRLQLVSELRPPEGYEFDSGVGTTFSLDLESLLTVPLSLALCEFESRDEAMKNPEAVLEGLRRIAGKLFVFCHRGRIKRPKEGTVLFSFLEDMVVQALPGSGAGAFHPKVWVLRYRRGEETLLRILILSRNLTFDKSWDTAVVLEGVVQADRASAVRRNRRLGQFVQALAELSGDDASRVRPSLESLAADVARTEFDVPEGFEDFAFWPLGIGSDVPPVLDWDHTRMMVISPFLSDLSADRDRNILDRLVYKRSSVTQNVLVSRPDQLDALKPESIDLLQETTKIYVLDDTAVDAGKAAEGDEEGPIERPIDTLSGLHAKVYVIENGARVSVLAGSANATLAAWGIEDREINVEFVVELIGQRRHVGIEAIFGEAGAAEAGAGGMLRMLKPYNKPDVPTEVDADAVDAEKKIETSRRLLATLAMHVKISAEEGGDYGAAVTVPALALPDGVECRMWPITLPLARSQMLPAAGSGSTISFVGLSMFALSPFWAFRLRAKSGKAEQVVEFVLRLPLEGMPEGRTAAILASMINSSDRFLRYLALLLSDDPDGPGAGVFTRSGENGSSGADGRASWSTAVVFEDLVRAYSRNPKRLERIEALLGDLRSGGAGVSVVPADFEELWQAFRKVKA